MNTRGLIAVLVLLGGCGASSPGTTGATSGQPTTVTPSSARVVESSAPAPTAAPVTTATTVAVATTLPTLTTCSAAGMSRVVPIEVGLPPAVVVTRQAIVDAAVTCDWGALSALATRGPTALIYDFGRDGSGDPSSYWKGLESHYAASPQFPAMPPLRAIVTVLRAPYVRRTDSAGALTFDWPAAVGAHPLTEKDLDPVSDLYPREVLEIFLRSGFYIGWRTGIAVDGTWTYANAGD